MNRIVSFLVAFASPLCLAQPQPGFDIVRIYEYFVASNAAFGACATPDAELQKKFLANFMMVSTRTLQTLKERNPNASESDLTNAVEAKTNAIRQAVAEDIKQNGCESPAAKQLVKLHHFHADWKP